MLCTICIDDKELRVKSGANLLWTALDCGFYIPNLCAIREKAFPAASCRLCYVEVKGMPHPVTACTEKVAGGMSVRLNSPAIARLRSTAFDLLTSRHRVDCGHCPANKRCSLQEIARQERFKLNGKRFTKTPAGIPADTSHHLINFDRDKCVLCGRCVWYCKRDGTSVLDFAGRGIDTVVSTFANRPLADSGCNSCLSCASSCPVGSLYPKSFLPGIPRD